MVRRHGTGMFIAILALLVSTAGPALNAAGEYMSLTQAIQRLLEHGPGVQMDIESVRQGEGVLQSTAGQFDWMLTNGVSMERNHVPVSTMMSNFERNEQLSLGLGKMLRNGISFSVTASSMDLTDEITNIKPVNGADVSALVIVPLLRGLGKKNAAAEELAAESTLEATSRLTEYYLSNHIYNLVTAYWDYLTALGHLEIQKTVQEKEQKMLDIVEKLVNAGELATVYLEQTKGNHNTTLRGINEAGLNIFSSKRDIAVMLGYPLQELDAIPMPGDDFPDMLDPDMLAENTGEQLLEISLSSRGDYLSTVQEVRTQKIYLQQANDTRKPVLDLNMKVGYAGLQENDGRDRFLKSFSNNVSGVNSYIGLQLEFPLVNHSARGQVGYRESLLREAEIRNGQLANSIASEIDVILESIRQAIEQSRLAEESAAYFINVIDYEVLKAKNGSPDLTSLYVGIDRYRAAKTAQLEARKQYSISLARLRLATGTVLTRREDGWTYTPGAMVQLPPLP